jgi:DNA-binding CsgD family transcriptional regulator
VASKTATSGAIAFDDHVDAIYGAAIDVGRWPAVLDGIARQCGARGAMIMTASPDRMRWTASPGIAAVVDAFFAEGWHLTGGRADRLIADHHPGFCVETDYVDADALRQMPVQSDFLEPHGMVGGAGSLFQGLPDDACILTVEGCQTHDRARAAVPFLDRLRPHLGRALTIAAAVRARMDDAVLDALSLAGVAAAVITRDGRHHACNAEFEHAFASGATIAPITRAMRFRDQRLQAAVEEVRSTGVLPGGRSIPLDLQWRGYPAAAHMIPLTRGARDYFGSDGVLIVLASAGNVSIPGADLLRLMFDLTPAEARLTRSLLEGLTITDAARRHGVTTATARRQLASVFAKTGINRQGDLVRTLTGLGAGFGAT